MTLKTCVTARTGQLCSGQGPKEWQLTTPDPVTRKVKCKLIPQICSLQKDLILISGEGWRLGDHSQLWPSQNQDWASLQGIIFRRNVSNQRNPSHSHSDAPVFWPSHLPRPSLMRRALGLGAWPAKKSGVTNDAIVNGQLIKCHNNCWPATESHQHNERRHKRQYCEVCYLPNDRQKFISS